MSTVPAEIAGIGSTSLRLRVSPGFDPLKAAVGPEEYFVLSRIDGNITIREVLLTTGLAVDRAIAIITRLRSIGALLLPGETSGPRPATAPPRAATSGGFPTAVAPEKTGPRPLQRASPSPTLTPTLRHPTPTPAPTSDRSPVHGLELANPTAEELAALAEVSDLSDTERRRILAMARLADGRDPHALLGVPPGSDAKTLKRAYFLLSKEIHPDRYYGKRLGSFAARMPLVFEAASRAYARLTTTNRPQGTGPHHTRTEQRDQPQTPQEYAIELFTRACALEVGGDALEAMKLFAAAVRVDPQTRYLRRAASCALAAGQPKSAVEYAKKANSQAPNDPSSARLLAGAFRAAGKLADAEEVLVMAMALKSENDVLSNELRNDLADVRRLIAKLQAEI